MTGKNNTPGDPCNGNPHRVYHIDHADVVAPSASTVVNNHTVIIRFSFTIRISGESLERMFRVLKEKFGTIWKKQRETHFDGESSYEVMVYALEGTPSVMALALRYIREEMGDDVVTSVSYTSKKCHFERGGLTLSQAINIATHESDL